MLARSLARSPARPPQLLELPGSLLLERTQSSLYQRRSDYWAPDYFVEQLLRDRSVLVDDNASALIMPHILDPGVRAEAWLSGLQRAGGLFPQLQRPVLASGGRPVLMRTNIFEAWVGPRASDPRTSFYLQNTGLPDALGAKLDIALPLHDSKLMQDIRSFRTSGRDGNAQALAGLPELQLRRKSLFNLAIKTLEFYFVGHTRIEPLYAAQDRRAQCLDARLFVANASACPCLTGYSECVRQFVYHNYRHERGMFIRDPYIEKVDKPTETKVKNRGHTAAAWALSEEQRTAAFCLVPGGFNFDMVRGRGESRRCCRRLRCQCPCLCVRSLCSASRALFSAAAFRSGAPWSKCLLCPASSGTNAFLFASALPLAQPSRTCLHSCDATRPGCVRRSSATWK